MGELTHPVFYALDVNDLFQSIEGYRQELASMALPRATEAIHAKLFASISSIATKFQSFAANRSLHIDNQTFVRWREKLQHAAAIEEDCHKRIAALELQLMHKDTTIKNPPNTSDPTMKEVLERMQVAVADRESAEYAWSCQNQALELRIDDLLCNFYHLADVHPHRHVAQVHYQMQLLDEKDTQLARLTKFIHDNPRKTKPIEDWKQEKTTQTNHRFTSFRGKKAAHVDDDQLLDQLDAIRKLFTASESISDAAWTLAIKGGVHGALSLIKSRLLDYIARSEISSKPINDAIAFKANGKLIQRQMHPSSLQPLPQVIPRTKSALHRMPRIPTNQTMERTPPPLLNLEAAMHISNPQTSSRNC